MKITINGFRGILRAIIETAPITILGGKNAQGKSSIIQGMQAALTGNLIPFEDVLKNQSNLLVRSGSATGTVEIETETGSSKVSYPAAARIVEGSPIEISEYAAGLKSITACSTKERADILGKILKISPSKDELAKEIENAGISSAAVDRIWQTIEGQSWDAAWKHSQETGARLKGEWKQIAGEQYGDKKAEGWLPATWEADLLGQDPAKLQENVTIYNEFYIAAVSDTAVSDSVKASLQEQAGKLESLKQSILESEKTLQGYFTNERQIQIGLNALPAAEQPKTCDCPHCKKPVQIEGSSLKIPAILSADEISARKQIIAKTEYSLKDVKSRISDLNTTLATLRSDLKKSEDAAAQLKKLESRKGSKTSPEAIEECKKKLDSVVNRLEAFTKKQEADKRHRTIINNGKIIAILAPDGLRQTKLIAELQKLNGRIEQLCKISEWRRVEIRPDMSIYMDGTPLSLISCSEHFRVKTVIQVAIALIDGSQVVLIDGADILDAAGRLGMIKIIMMSKLTGVIGITYSSAEMNKETDSDKRLGLIKKILPDASKIGGRRYWIENGEAFEV